MPTAPIAGRSAWRARLPLASGWMTAAVGAVNVISALTPELHGRMALLARFAPQGVVFAAHAMVLPAGVALLALSFYLARRRQRALWLTVGVLALVGALEIGKGLDVEEALVSWGLAGLLLWGRASFTVRHDDSRLGAAMARALVAALLALAEVRLHAGGAIAWVPFALGLRAVGTLFAPLRTCESSPRDRVLATALVRRHGSDTLSVFKLRRDIQTLVAPDRRSFLSYRIDNGVLLVSGDPIGPADAIPALLRHLEDFAAQRGLRIGAIGAGDGFATLARAAGLRALYLGDEAVVRTASFSLDGHRIKKVRQACNRVARAGFSAEVRRVATLSGTELAELEGISARWRGGAAERGFSMAMDTLAGEHLADSVVIIGRDAAGRARGFLHFVPTYGRAAASLSAMRGDRDTPNGLMDFLVVRAIELLRERGVEEVSLNFAAFARWLHSPAGRVERVLAAILRRCDRHFQIESLYRFNAKFSPDWHPRFLLYEGVASLPRTALAAMWAEGQLPKPALRLRPARAPRPALSAAAAPE